MANTSFSGRFWAAADPPGLPGEVFHVRLRLRPRDGAGGGLLLQRPSKSLLDHPDPRSISRYNEILF